MSDEFNKWLNSDDHGIFPSKREVDFAKKAWESAIGSSKERYETRHGHCPCGCKHYVDGYCLSSCKHWKPIDE